jgi:integration host factor subunit alpha
MTFLPLEPGPSRATPTEAEMPEEAFTLTKAELAEMLFERVGLNKREAKDMVERPGRNPKTGEEIPISARRVVTFHASQKLKNQIEGETA